MPEDRQRMCGEVTELLPFLFNGSLDTGEADRVRRHLAECGVCRGEAAAWDEVAAIHATHPDADALTALAFGEPGDDGGRAIAAHLAVCEECRELVDAARQVRGLPPADGIAPPAEIRPRLEPGIPRSTWTLLAASLLIAIGALGWSWWTVDAERSAWNAERTELEGRLRELGGPRADVTLVELFSTRNSVRAAGAPESATDGVDLPLGTGPVHVLLFVDSTAVYDGYRLDIRQPDESVRLRVENVVPQGPGTFSVLLPPSSLEPGPAVLEISGSRDGEWEILGRFPVRVRS